MDMRNYSGKDLERRDEIRGRAKKITKAKMGDIETGTRWLYWWKTRSYH